MVNNQEKEFVCYTCATNKELEKVKQREEETPTNKPVWISMRGRRTIKGVGLCFTKESIFFAYHLRADIDHDWGNVAQMEQQHAEEKAQAEKEALEKLVIKTD